MKRIIGDCRVCLEQERHKYFDRNGREFESVSSVLNSVYEPFDTKKMSYVVAKKNLPKDSSIEEIKREQEVVEKEWEKKRDESATYGSNIHKNIEDYLSLGRVNDNNHESVCMEIGSFVSDYYDYAQEAIIYDKEFGIAGTIDLILKRQRSDSSLFDLVDYKTNLYKGIVYDSTAIKDGTKKHYNRFMMHPLSHLEDCNYNRYALQLSVYAYILMNAYNIRIGRLSIFFISPEMKLSIIPISFLYKEAELLVKTKKNLTPLPSPDKEDDKNSMIW